MAAETFNSKRNKQGETNMAIFMYNSNKPVIITSNTTHKGLCIFMCCLSIKALLLGVNATKFGIYVFKAWIMVILFVDKINDLYGRMI